LNIPKNDYDAHTLDAAIEPRIGHLKSDHRLSRNYHKGIKGANSSDELQADDEHLKGAFVYFLASLDADSWFTLFAIADIPTTKNDFLRDDYVIYATRNHLFHAKPL
jgi:hypothetical protein